MFGDPVKVRSIRTWEGQRFRVLAVTLMTFLFLVSGGCRGEEAEGPAARQDAELEFQDPEAELQVGFVLVGATTDWGWNYQHNEGRLALEREMRGRVDTVLAENIPENADAERVMQRMAAQGADLIFSTSYGYSDFALRAAQRNPEVVLMQAQAPLEAPNAATYNGNIWEASYVAGVVAATSLPEVNRYGFVGAHPIPPIFWTVNAFALGLQSVNPNATVDIVYTNSWHDPAAETEAVNGLAAQGVSAVYALVDSTIAVIQAAEKAGIHSISHHADLSQFAPERYITGVVWQWGKLYQDVARQVMEGTWKPEPISGGFKEGYVGLATFGPAVTQEAEQASQDAIERIVSGGFNVFQGPIYDSGGTLRVPEGEALDVPAIVSLDWVAQGVRSPGS